MRFLYNFLILAVALIFLINFAFAYEYEYDTNYFSINYKFTNFSTSSALQKASEASESMADTVGTNPIKFFLVQDTSGKDYTFGSQFYYYDFSKISNEMEFLDLVLPTVAQEYLYRLEPYHGDFYEHWFGQGLSETLKNLTLKKQGINVSESLDLEKEVFNNCKNEIKQDLNLWTGVYHCYTFSGQPENCLKVLDYIRYCPSYPDVGSSTIQYYASSYLVNKLFDSDLDKIKLFFQSARQCNADFGRGWDGENVLYDYPTRNIRYHIYPLNPNADKIFALGGLNYLKFEDYNKQISDFSNFLSDNKLPEGVLTSERDLASLNKLLCAGQYDEIPTEISKRTEAINTITNSYHTAEIDLNKLIQEATTLPKSECKNTLQKSISELSINTIDVYHLQSQIDELNNDLYNCKYAPKKTNETENNQLPEPASLGENKPTPNQDNYLPIIALFVVGIVIVITIFFIAKKVELK